jgi:hypothetical protein
MIADPTTLRNAQTSAVFDLVSTIGSKTIRQQVSGLQTYQTAGLLTISHDQNDKTKRKRSVLRLDSSYTDSSGLNKEDSAVYLVIDRTFPAFADPTGAQTKAMVAMICAFFATDPTAATPGSIPYAINTTLGTKLYNGEP